MDATLTGWQRETACPRCGAKATLLTSTATGADYECRGTPTEPRTAYGPDRCGAVFGVRMERRS